MRFASARITRLTIAPLLALWVAGAGCLFGCEFDIMAAENGGSHGSNQKLSSIVSGEACASSKSHDCCSGRANKSSRTPSVNQERVPSEPMVLPDGSGAMLGCPLATQGTAVITKVGFKDASAAAPVNPVTALQNPGEQRHSSSTHFHLPNRGHTYLRCCTFLI